MKFVDSVCYLFSKIIKTKLFKALKDRHPYLY